MKLPALPLLLAVVAAPASAHPHHHTDQQVSLVLTAEGVRAVIQIVPSDVQGPAIFALLDVDGDSRLSDAEMRGFAARIIAEASLSVDGAPDALTLVAVSRPARAEVETGHALIAIEARGTRPIGPGAAAHVRFAITFDDFAPEWFVQPWVDPSFLAGGQVPAIERGANNASVSIRLPGV